MYDEGDAIFELIDCLHYFYCSIAHETRDCPTLEFPLHVGDFTHPMSTSPVKWRL